MSQSSSLTAILDTLAGLDAENRGVRPAVSIAVLRNYTADLLVPLLKHQVFAMGLVPAIRLGHYGTIRQDADALSNGEWGEPADLVVVSIVLDYLDPESLGHAWDGTAARETILGILDLLVQRTSSTILINRLLGR